MNPTPLLPVLTGSFSSPAAGNPTGPMVEAAYRHHDILARYINCEVPDGSLADAVNGAKAMGWSGFNLSLPHKQAVVPLLDSLSESAALIGAVNCVVHRGGEWVGENTDGQGFVAALRAVADPAREHFIVFGAGGAARAITVELALAGTPSITIVNRDHTKALALAQLLTDRTNTKADTALYGEGFRIPDRATVAINATSVGLAPRVEDRLEVDAASLRSDLLVCDVVPNPPVTALIRDAQLRGARTLDGRSMLVNQAAINVELWTGVAPTRTVMRDALDETIGSES